jgi:hypothetical protein
MPGCATTAANLHPNGDMWRFSSKLILNVPVRCGKMSGKPGETTGN